MKNLKFILLGLFLVLPLAIFAQGNELDVTTPVGAITALTPFIVFAGVQLIKFIKPIMPVWLLGILVPGLSALVVWVTGMLGTPDLSWFAQFGLGLVATFIHQIIKQLNEAKSKL